MGRGWVILDVTCLCLYQLVDGYCHKEEFCLLCNSFVCKLTIV